MVEDATGRRAIAGHRAVAQDVFMAVPRLAGDFREFFEVAQLQQR
jgi:hypothetical protein